MVGCRDVIRSAPRLREAEFRTVFQIFSLILLVPRLPPSRPWHGGCECLGMTKKITTATDDALLARVEQFTRQALAEGTNPAELSCALTTVAVRIGIDLAPNAGIAFAVVMRAVSDAAAELGLSQAPQDGDLENGVAIGGRTIH